MDTEGLAEIAESIRRHLDAKHRAREEALALTREVIRLSANAIRAVHRREFDTARARLAEAKENLARTTEALAGHSNIFHAGFVHDAQKEYAEASCTLALISGQPLPSDEELGVMSTAYLNGLGETVGELRRHLLDSLRHGNMRHCEECLEAMSDVYDVLVTMDYPEAVTAGLRRTTDATRGILERTRGDFSIAYTQRRLEQRLDDLRHDLGTE